MHYAPSLRHASLLLALLFLGCGCSAFGQTPSEREGKPLPHNFDVDGDGTRDITFERGGVATESGVASRYFAAWMSPGEEGLVTDQRGFLAPLKEGTRIDSSLSGTLKWFSSGTVYSVNVPKNRRKSPWDGTGKKYFGFRLGKGDTARYGWALISVDAAEGRSTPERLVEAMLYDYAFGASGEAIRTGEKP
jgi:hypothetical protein